MGGLGAAPPESGRLHDSLLEEPGTEYEALVQKWISDYLSKAQVIPLSKARATGYIVWSLEPEMVDQ